MHVRDVIVLHAPQDAAHARAIAEALRGYGLAASPAAPQPTPSLRRARFARASAILVLWSSASVADAELLEEAEAAKAAGKYVPAALSPHRPASALRRWQAADVSACPGPESAVAIAGLAGVLRQLEDGRLARYSIARSYRAFGVPRFLASARFWAGGVALASFAALAMLADLLTRPKPVPAEIGAALAVFVAIMLTLFCAARAALHISRRAIGLHTAAFFTREFMITLAAAPLAGLAIALAAGLAEHSKSVVFLAALAVASGAMIIALGVLAARLVRRLGWGPARPRVPA